MEIQINFYAVELGKKMNKKYRFDYFTPPGCELVDSSLVNEIFDEFGNYKIPWNEEFKYNNTIIRKE